VKISYYQIVSPFVGGAVGWLAARGLALTPDQTTALTGIAAGAVASAVHVIEAWVGPKATTPTVTIAAGKQDPAKPASGTTPPAS
jgi:uncharacterized membrane protein (DUF441 family)